MTSGRVLITGGAGFIGSNLACSFARDGWDVVVSDWLGCDNKWRNLEDIDIEDIVSPSDVSALLGKGRGAVDAVVHMGAISATTEVDVDRLVQNNLRLSIDLWRWCAMNGVPFIYASSAAVYGDGTLGFDDRAPLGELRPLNAYGWSKLAFDRRVMRDVLRGGAIPPQWAGLRFFNVYGPREEHKGRMRSVASQIMLKTLRREPVTLFRSHRPDVEDGGQRRDFVAVEDCVDVVRWLLANSSVSGIFNLGSGQARSFRDVAVAVLASMNRTEEIEFVDTPEDIRSKYQYFTQADMSRLRAAGYKKVFKSLEDGIADYVSDWMRREAPLL